MFARDPETLARQEALAKKEKMDKDDQERMLEFIERQVRLAELSAPLVSLFISIIICYLYLCINITCQKL